MVHASSLCLVDWFPDKAVCMVHELPVLLTVALLLLQLLLVQLPLLSAAAATIAAVAAGSSDAVVAAASECHCSCVLSRSVMFSASLQHASSSRSCSRRSISRACCFSSASISTFHV